MSNTPTLQENVSQPEASEAVLPPEDMEQEAISPTQAAQQGLQSMELGDR